MTIFAGIAEIVQGIVSDPDLGTPVTFSRTTRVEDPATGQSTTTAITVAGHAIRTKGDALRLQALGIVERDVVVLLFTAATYGDTPRPGDTVEWPAGSGARPYTVRDVDPVAPDGPSIIARVTVTR